MTRGSQTPRCYCDAYNYPHRTGAGACKKTELNRVTYDETLQSVHEEQQIDKRKEERNEHDESDGNSS